MSLIVRTLSDQLADLVRARILTGEVAADGPIRQEALAAQLGVSKIPLREALARLEQEGLLRSEPNRGFFVRGLSRREAEEIYALRLKLEPEAVGRAAVRASQEEQGVAHEMLAALERSTQGRDVSAAGAANRAFHLALIAPSGSTLTTSLLERLHVLAERYVTKHLEPLGRDVRAAREHWELLQCWTARDEAASAALTRQHIEQTLKDLRAQLAA